MSTVSQSDIDDVERFLRAYLELADAFFSVSFPMPSYDLKLRGGGAGKAFCHRWHLQFNGQLLVRNRARFVREVTGHELAHLIAYRQYGTRIKPHGQEWRHVMGIFNLTPSTRHDFDVTGLRASRSPYIYTCACQGQHALGGTRHKRIQQMRASYHCLKCGQKLSYSHDLRA